MEIQKVSPTEVVSCLNHNQVTRKTKQMKEATKKVFNKVWALIETAAVPLEHLASTSPKTVLVVGGVLGVSATISGLAAVLQSLPLIIEWVTASVALGFRSATVAFVGAVAYLAIRTAVAAYKKIPSKRATPEQSATAPSSSQA